MTDPLLATLLGSGWGYEHHLLTPTAGPQLAVVRLPHLHRVSLACWLRAGSRYEPPCDNGLSHMVEHMMFRGTADHPSPFDINLAVEDLGGT
ncbi:MAG TPA: insulinase family protein, partial [Candidatus Paceibacterota bacterium]|nr:insulinase family protein [Candidatus Paceibacterota bacterium]